MKTPETKPHHADWMRNSINVSAMQPLFNFWIDDEERDMAGTRYRYYWDEKSDRVYVTSQYDDAASFHGSSLFGPNEVTKEAALAKAKEHCPEELERIKKVLGKSEETD